MMNRRKLLSYCLGAFLGASAYGSFPIAHAQEKGSQVVNNAYVFNNASPAYDIANGPKVTVHRAVSPYVERGSFDAFGELIKSDGFQFDWLDQSVSEQSLASTDIFVIANAYTKGGANDFTNFGTLDAPSVYSDEEISSIVNWVQNGGSLLLLADHSPFAGGTIKLAEALGFIFMTGSAVHKSSTAEDIIAEIDFRKDNSTGFRIGKLAEHAITNGSLGRAPVEGFYTFSGQAIIPPADATNLLTIPANFESVLTFALRRDFDSAGRIDSSGFSQGAVLELGKGRVAVFGETGSFTSQVLHGSIAMGLGAPEAPQNEEFVLSTLRWLSRFEPK